MFISKTDAGSPGSLYIPNTFSPEAFKEACLYLQGKNGRCIRRDLPPKKDLADLKEDALRKHSFLHGEDLEKLIEWHRQKVEDFPFESWFAYKDGKLVGMGALEEKDNALLLSSGYARAHSAVAAITALRIVHAEQEGHGEIFGRVFRKNMGGQKHLLRWGFVRTNKWEMSHTSKNEIDIWKKELRSP